MRVPTIGLSIPHQRALQLHVVGVDKRAWSALGHEPGINDPGGTPTMSLTTARRIINRYGYRKKEAIAKVIRKKENLQAANELHSVNL